MINFMAISKKVEFRKKFLTKEHTLQKSNMATDTTLNLCLFHQRPPEVAQLPTVT